MQSPGSWMHAGWREGKLPCWSATACFRLRVRAGPVQALVRLLTGLSPAGLRSDSPQISASACEPELLMAVGAAGCDA